MPSCRSAQRFPQRAPGGSPSPWGPVSPGWHSDQGSQNPRIAFEFRLWKMIRSIIPYLFAENLDARLAGIVIWSDYPLLEKKSSGDSNWQNMTKLTIYMLNKSWASFFWGRRSAAGSDHQTHRAGDHNLVSKQCQRKTLSKNSRAKPCQRNILSKSYILTVSDGIFWVSPIYFLYTSCIWWNVLN